MPSDVPKKRATVAIVGNPNTGKSTFFTALAGVRQRVGNYPGVTVEQKTAELSADNISITLIDLPGLYSLVPQSPDEQVTVDVLLGQTRTEAAPDVVLCILDASNLRRNMYLASQVLELGLPTILALNKVDVAARAGIHIDAARLQERLGSPVVLTRANKGVGVEEIRDLLIQHSSIVTEASYSTADESCPNRRLICPCRDPRQATEARYTAIAGLLDGVIRERSHVSASTSDHLDRLLTNKLWGGVIFVMLMAVAFQAVFAWASPAMDGIETGIGWLGQRVSLLLPDGMLQSLVVDGVIAGVGAVLVFLPQILLLFLFIAILEDCGYMARAAYLMDNLMSKVGLSGKSFIPLLSSFACAVPGVLATRVIENRRDRLVTILIAPLMCCSARLPIYTLLIGAFIPARKYLGGWIGLQGLTMIGLYFLGMAVAVVVAVVLKKTLLPGETPSFVMELPAYQRPSIKFVLHRIFDQGWNFVRAAGTMILAVTILVWAAAYFPRDVELEKVCRSRIQTLEMAKSIQTGNDNETARRDKIDEQIRRIENEWRGVQMQQSYLGRAGHWIEPVVRPLGWDWRIGCSVIASFPAREVVIGTLGVLYNLGEEQDEDSTRLRERLHSATWNGTTRPVYTIPVALSIMVFFALCVQCVATLVMIRNETNSWRWPAFTFAYMTFLAYAGALITYQVGTRWFS